MAVIFRGSKLCENDTYSMTVSAVYRLTPSPPARVDRQKTKVSDSGLEFDQVKKKE